MEVPSAVDRIVHESYSRLLAFLAARSGDLAGAEDALSDAFLAALQHWPKEGVPQKPEAWLLTVARRRLIDRARQQIRQTELLPDLLEATAEAQDVADRTMEFPDERLKLLFVCAHPAIAEGMRTPLMLQTVLGLDAARIASAFLVQPATMGQRLSRAKTKIREARIPFEVPERDELPPRLDAVLQALYAAYGTGWDDVAGADARRKGLAHEAIELARLLTRLMPDEPEAWGLLALMLYCESRREARRNAAGEYVPLSEQDVTLWSRPLIAEAEHALSVAAKMNRLGRFQLEAAIQSVHAQRVRTGRIDWETVALLYEGLVRIAPSIGALVARAASVAEARDAETGWALLQAIPAEKVISYQPYWALAAHLLRRLCRFEEAREAYSRAMGLCEDAAMREFLLRQMQEIAQMKEPR
jgi:RNA polymerase sigma-70 factor (ECF subfamily)